jgi:hypothetical protein
MMLFNALCVAVIIHWLHLPCQAFHTDNSKASFAFVGSLCANRALRLYAAPAPVELEHLSSVVTSTMLLAREMEYSVWENIALESVKGGAVLPLAVLAGFLTFSLNSVKSEIKADMKADKSDMKADMAALKSDMKADMVVFQVRHEGGYGCSWLQD